ncbi:ribonucleotide reductase N-terminal alpha domain-containing protein [Hankyongella ginsenosidimutans]|uniref:ribonucleotide reductase N-terminal alpha domain-containing protein n=1 Tax=Hankyongella ginsenosidimutans TaxID=1763828 RepID=UPI001CA32A3E|nr:ribonucleotide reductase N-terminal alpha domain-containing protein [Hankyongella ginsenosidimutans]
MPFDTPLAEEIWDKKYRFRSDAGEDADLAATLDRVADAVAKAEKPAHRKLWRARFREALSDFRFIPAGRILAGAGTARNVTLFNCFVMGTILDSLPGIFEHLREAAITMQQGAASAWIFRPYAPQARR